MSSTRGITSSPNNPVSEITKQMAVDQYQFGGGANVYMDPTDFMKGPGSVYSPSDLPAVRDAINSLPVGDIYTNSDTDPDFTITHSYYLDDLMMGENSFVWGNNSVLFKGTIEKIAPETVQVDGNIKPFNEEFDFIVNPKDNALVANAKIIGAQLYGPGDDFDIIFGPSPGLRVYGAVSKTVQCTGKGGCIVTYTFKPGIPPIYGPRVNLPADPPPIFGPRVDPNASATPTDDYRAPPDPRNINQSYPYGTPDPRETNQSPQAQYDRDRQGGIDNNNNDNQTNQSPQAQYDRDRQGGIDNNNNDNQTNQSPQAQYDRDRQGGIDNNNNDNQTNQSPQAQYDRDRQGGTAPDHTATEDRRPILLDIAGTGIAITELTSSNRFMDAEGSGLLHRTAWAGTGTGVLFYDPNNEGAIVRNDQYIFTEWDPTAKGDLEALRNVFDSNGDGVFTSADAKFALFKIEVTNADGTTSVMTLAQAGITSINLKADLTHVQYADGSAITGQTTFTRVGGSTGTVANTSLASESAGYAVTKVVTTMCPATAWSPTRPSTPMAPSRKW